MGVTKNPYGNNLTVNLICNSWYSRDPGTRGARVNSSATEAATWKTQIL